MQNIKLKAVAHIFDNGHTLYTNSTTPFYDEIERTIMVSVVGVPKITKVHSATLSSVISPVSLASDKEMVRDSKRIFVRLSGNMIYFLVMESSKMHKYYRV